MAVWPTSLPQEFERRGFRETLPDSRLFSSNDVGPPKVRARSTLETYVIEGNMPMTAAQVTTLRDFIRDTLLFGVEQFDFPEPRDSGNTLNVRISPTGPTISPLGASYQVSLSLQVLP